jgi:thymidylate synthase ThyX
MTPAERLAAHVTNLDRPVYALHGLPPEVVAVLFAQVSRSPAGFRENLLKLMEEDRLPLASTRHGFDQARAAAFHEKWVLGYGHASVAEHAVLHVAVEDCSILAAKALEEARLASFTEKSSRYQVFDEGRFHVPEEWRGRCWESAALALVGELYAAYTRVLQWARARLEAGPRAAGLSDRAWRQAVHASACDTARYLLPAGAKTSLGMTLNARVAAHLIRRLRAHPLAELRQLGDRLEEEGCRITPVLLRHSRPSDHQRGLAATLAEVLPPAGGTGGADWPRVRLVDWDADAELRILADWILQSRPVDLAEARRVAAGLDAETRRRIFDRILGGRGPHDQAPRALEQATVTVEFCLDYGAFRDLQRHRMLSPTLTPLGCRWGWELPDELQGCPWQGEVEDLLARVRRLWETMAREEGEAAAYLVPLAFRHRFVLKMNLRECDHLIRLRSTPAGHASYRRAAWQLLAELRRALPGLAGHLQEPGRSDEEDGAPARQAELLRQEGARERAAGTSPDG